MSKKDKGKGKATIQPNTPQKPDRPMTIRDYVSDKSLKIKTYDQIVSQQPASSSKKTEYSQYIPKEFIMNVCPVEPEFRKQNIADTIQAIFPTHPIEGNWNFIPQHSKKDRIYYEYILVASKSISITHKESEGNPYSQIKILQVLTPTTWGYSPYTAKKFPFWFFYYMRVPWIMSWCFSVMDQRPPSPSIFYLARISKWYACNSS